MFEFKNCTDGDKDVPKQPLLRYRTDITGEGLLFQVYDEMDASWYTVACVNHDGLIDSDTWDGWQMVTKRGLQTLAESGASGE